MVFNSTRHVKLPFSNAVVRPHMNRVLTKGEGMGSVLLRTGGGGAGSSYQDIDDYVRTTGINPYARASKKPTGTGLKNLSSKLEKLNIIPDKMKKKNITMSF
jgi:hypothetical protein